MLGRAIFVILSGSSENKQQQKVKMREIANTNRMNVKVYKICFCAYPETFFVARATSWYQMKMALKKWYMKLEMIW